MSQVIRIANAYLLYVPESMKKCVSSTLHWNTLMLDGSGETFGQQNMKQQEGYVLYE